MMVAGLGGVVRALLITESDVEPVDVKLTPAGVAEKLGTDAFTVIYRHLYTIPLTLVYCDEVSDDALETVDDDTQSLYGPILVFHRGEPFGDLGDFEMSCVLNCIDMVKRRQLTVSPRSYPTEVDRWGRTGSSTILRTPRSCAGRRWPCTRRT